MQCIAKPHQNDKEVSRITEACFVADYFSDERLLGMLTKLVAFGGTISIETQDTEIHCEFQGRKNADD